MTYQLLVDAGSIAARYVRFSFELGLPSAPTTSSSAGGAPLRVECAELEVYE